MSTGRRMGHVLRILGAHKNTEVVNLLKELNEDAIASEELEAAREVRHEEKERLRRKASTDIGADSDSDEEDDEVKIPNGANCRP